MKSRVFRIRIILFVLLMTGTFLLGTSYAQAPSPPQHRRSGNQSGGGYAPVGEGIVMLLSLATGYSIVKLKRAHHKNSRRKSRTQQSLPSEIHDPQTRVR